MAAISHTSKLATTTTTMPTASGEIVSEPQKKEHAKPVFGSSGRKIVYDKDGKPYV